MPLSDAERAAHSPGWAKRVESCPNQANHVYGPAGYLAWHEWAEQQMKTHRQKKCPGCGLYLIHERKKSRVDS